MKWPLRPTERRRRRIQWCPVADLFVSYSRKDKEFVRHLVDGLVGREKEVWVDWEDIAPTAEWMSEIELGIDASDSFAFVISPDSLTSGTWGRGREHTGQAHRAASPP